MWVGWLDDGRLGHGSGCLLVLIGLNLWIWDVLSMCLDDALSSMFWVLEVCVRCLCPVVGKTDECIDGFGVGS